MEGRKKIDTEESSLRFMVNKAKSISARSAFGQYAVLDFGCGIGSTVFWAAFGECQCETQTRSMTNSRKVKMTNNYHPPNTFIIGMPKCGNSTVGAVLRQSPEVFIPDNQELHFYNSDMDHRTILSQREYEKIYDKERKVIVDGSVFYLYSDTAVSSILKHHPNSKFIILTRDHEELLESLYYHFLYEGIETRIPELAFSDNQFFYMPKSLLCYPELIQYRKRIARIQELIPRDKIFIADLADMKRRHETYFSKLFDFLEIQSFEFEYSVKNARKKKLIPLLNPLVYALGGYFGDIKKLFGIKYRFGFAKKIVEANSYNTQTAKINFEDFPIIMDAIENDKKVAIK